MLFKKEICFISSFKYILFIYLMHQASVTARGIFVVSWGVFRCHVWALVVALGPRSAQPSVVAAQGLSSVACGILVPPPGIEPACPVLQAEFLTTGPPEKPRFPLF